MNHNVTDSSVYPHRAFMRFGPLDFSSVSDARCDRGEAYPSRRARVVVHPVHQLDAALVIGAWSTVLLDRNPITGLARAEPGREGTDREALRKVAY